MNEALAPVMELIRREPSLTFAVALGAYAALFALTTVTLFRYGRLARQQERLLRGADGTSLERMLLDQIETAGAVRDRISDGAERGAANAALLRRCLQNFGMTRYDAFSNVGGEQSFSLALLDADANGLVLSALVSRNDMRIYAKQVQTGASAQALTDEEKRAITISCASAGAAVPAKQTT